MDEDGQPDEPEREPRQADRLIWRRIAVALGIALIMGLGIYALAEAAMPAGLISFTFLFVLPVAINGIVCVMIDPRGTRSLGAHMLVPVWLLLGAILLGAVVLREGVICIIMLAPLWLGLGMAGAGLAYRFTHGGNYGRTYCAAMLAAPLVATQVEPSIPVPEASASVTRSIVVDAPPERIWPLLRGIPDVRPGEGRWNVSQDVIGIPRPLGARLVGEGLGADRYARWGHHIRFRERITQWAPNRRIGWRFIFDDIESWRFTDRHLMPNSAYFRVVDGGYSLERLDAGHTRLTIDTRYWMKTPVNLYSSLWGEFFLGDLENNLLALVRDRAEGTSPGRD